MLLLNFLQFAKQAIVLGVSNLRVVQHIVAVGVMLHLLTQLGSPFRELHLGNLTGEPFGPEIANAS